MPFTLVTKPTRARGVLLASAACAFLLGAAPAAQAAPLTLYAAGSLNIALGTVAANFTAATGTPIVTMAVLAANGFGPPPTCPSQAPWPCSR